LGTPGQDNHRLRSTDKKPALIATKRANGETPPRKTNRNGSNHSQLVNSNRRGRIPSEANKKLSTLTKN